MDTTATCGDQLDKPFQSSSEPEITVIIPTYKEAQNIRELVNRIHNVAFDAGIILDIVIVDDASNDGTFALCNELSSQYPICLIVRENRRGLASAVLDGMKKAVGNILVVMDADLSHPPEAIPELISAITHGGADFAIGSRYVHGGNVESTWGLARRALSRIATWLARPLVAIQDPMSGFFALRREAFSNRVYDINPVGFKIGLELVVKLQCRKVVEVPIMFRQRRRGSSKLSLHENLLFLEHLLKLYAFKLTKA